MLDASARIHNRQPYLSKDTKINSIEIREGLQMRDQSQN